MVKNFEVKEIENHSIMSCISEVDNTLTLDWNLCLFSSDQSGIFFDRASAKYGASFGCSGINFIASNIEDEYSALGTSLIYLNNRFITKSNSDFSNFEKDNIFSLRLLISSERNSGEYNIYPFLDNTLINLKTKPLLINAWNTMLASITNSSILQETLCLFAIPDLTSSASINDCSFVSLLFDNISSDNENSTSSINSLTTLSNAISNFSFNSAGTSTLNVTSAMVSPDSLNANGYINLLERFGEKYGSGIVNVRAILKKNGNKDLKYILHKIETKVIAYSQAFNRTVEKILTLIKASLDITEEELSKKSGLTIRGVEWNISKLRKKGLLHRIGPDKGGYWKVK